MLLLLSLLLFLWVSGVLASANSSPSFKRTASYCRWRSDVAARDGQQLPAGCGGLAQPSLFCVGDATFAGVYLDVWQEPKDVMAGTEGCYGCVAVRRREFTLETWS